MGRRAGIVGCCAVALALAACGADRDDSLQPSNALPAASPPATSPLLTDEPLTEATRWEIRSWEFLADVPAVAGQPVEVVNLDGADHTLTDVDGSFEAYVQADGTTLLTVDRPGTYAVWCRIHPDMRGTVVVDPVP
ncbi:MAG: hypothetical protein ABMA25_00070 [Ilumatobacteraceae bacterium]